MEAGQRPEGDREGLVAVLQVNHSADEGRTYHGYIIDATLLPPARDDAAAE